MNEQMAYTMVNPQTGNLAFKIFSLQDNSPFDHLQRHNYYTIILLTSGSGTLKADFAQYPFAANSMMCFVPYQPFMLSTRQKLQGFALNFHPDFFCIHKHQKEVSCNGVLFNNIYDPPVFSLQPEQTAKFEALAEQMKTEMQQVELAQYELLVTYLKLFLITASRVKVTTSPDAHRNVEAGTEPFVLQQLKESIEQHFKTKHSAGDYSDLLNISSRALAKITKAHFNKTLTHLIAERIIIEAKRELYLTSKTVKEIAYGLGFSDEYYFSRFFKTNADVSPQLFRETVGFARAEA